MADDDTKPVEIRKDCEHLADVTEVPASGLNVKDPCEDCQETDENWVCLTCYKVYCSRYAKGHMVTHWGDAKHPVVLSYADLSVWCYNCESYLENEVLKAVLEAAHKSKFGSDS